MNIFAVDPQPHIAARVLCDKHVASKMIIESAQMIQNCFKSEDLAFAPLTQGGKQRTNRNSINHPCSKWVLESKENFEWLLDHAWALIEERHHRWPHQPPHFTEEFIIWAILNKDLTIHTSILRTPFVLVISKDLIERIDQDKFNKLDIYQKYQVYLALDKTHLHQWTNRPKPPFIEYYQNYFSYDKNV